MSGEVMIRFLVIAVGIKGKPSRDLEGRQYGRSRVVSELAVETWLDWTGRLIFFSFFNFPQEKLCSSHLVGVQL